MEYMEHYGNEILINKWLQRNVRNPGLINLKKIVRHHFRFPTFKIHIIKICISRYLEKLSTFLILIVLFYSCIYPLQLGYYSKSNDMKFMRNIENIFLFLPIVLFMITNDNNSWIFVYFYMHVCICTYSYDFLYCFLFFSYKLALFTWQYIFGNILPSQ